MLPSSKQIWLTQPASFPRLPGTVKKELPPNPNKPRDLPNHPSPHPGRRRSKIASARSKRPALPTAEKWCSLTHSTIFEKPSPTNSGPNKPLPPNPGGAATPLLRPPSLAAIRPRPHLYAVG